ncbi:hypothetical protein NUW54_g1737 [Trametes sanguinea]|uniref:Uncharacterized protein n=1 Tax=Trametes sanguinea TaxID=158606 RepID=A0ACC1Q6X0_9APHY|nr:hypothetical protein NUW54_g1737 [Trametes sanguinea]
MLHAQPPLKMNPEMSATHRCLLVNEIFHQIATELHYDPDSDGSGERHALVQLAVLEEWAGCDTNAPLGYTFSLTSVPVVYNATSA